MRIHVANYEPDRLGGGWSFARNFVKGMREHIVPYEEAQVYFITSASMTQRDDVKQAKADGKKIVLRVDNAIRDSRNRGTGMSRLKDFAEMADLVVYQSSWAEAVLEDYLKPGIVIINSVDTDIFNAKGRSDSDDCRFLYSRFNRDETKNWEIARFIFQANHMGHIRDKQNHSAKLSIVGQFSPELLENNFDFYMGEKIQYLGVVKDPVFMADIYKQNDFLIYTYFNDACSNTLIEALCCGVEIVDDYDMATTGGSAEIMHMFNDHGGINHFGLTRMCDEYKEAIGDLV